MKTAVIVASVIGAIILLILLLIIVFRSHDFPENIQCERTGGRCQLAENENSTCTGPGELIDRSGGCKQTTSEKQYICCRTIN